MPARIVSHHHGGENNMTILRFFDITIHSGPILMEFLGILPASSSVETANDIRGENRLGGIMSNLVPIPICLFFAIGIAQDDYPATALDDNRRPNRVFRRIKNAIISPGLSFILAYSALCIIFPNG